MIFNLRLLVWQSEPMERRGRLAGGLDPNTGVSCVGYRELAPPSALASRVSLLGLDMLRSSDA